MITVVIPTFERFETLLLTVEKLRYSAPSELISEILVVDNCSRDWDSERFSHLEELDSRLRHIRNPRNFGGGKNMLVGLSEACNNWSLVMSDEDSLHLSHRRASALKALVESNEAFVIAVGVANKNMSWSIKGQLGTGPVSPGSVFDLTFYISGLMVNRERMSETIQRIEGAIDTNEMARLYPQTLLMGSAAIVRAAWNFAGVLVQQGEPQVSQASLEQVPYDYPSKRMRQLEGFCEFMDAECEVLESNSLGYEAVRQMKRSMACRSVWTLPADVYRMDQTLEASILSAISWKFRLTLRRLQAQLPMLEFWLKYKIGRLLSNRRL